MEIKLKLSKPGRRFWLLLGAIVLLTAVAALVVLLMQQKNPIPESITKQANFKTVYPTDISLVKGQKTGFEYQSQQKSLTYSASFQGTSLSVVQQAAPSNLTNGTGVYFQALGLHPIAQFNSKLGPVAVLNFFSSGSLEPAGQSGILIAGKTMVIASTTDSKAKLSIQQWQSYFDSLNQAK